MHLVRISVNNLLFILCIAQLMGLPTAQNDTVAPSTKEKVVRRRAPVLIKGPTEISGLAFLGSLDFELIASWLISCACTHTFRP